MFAAQRRERSYGTMLSAQGRFLFFSSFWREPGRTPGSPLVWASWQDRADSKPVGGEL
jgi:hypothetical protein